MSLEPIQLDDLTWADLVTAARERIAPVSQGQWTLHAPVDPGITLLELYAAQLEQRLFWMDQDSPAIQTALLQLLGVQRRAASPARTVMCFRTGLVSELTERETLVPLTDSKEVCFTIESQRAEDPGTHFSILPLIEKGQSTEQTTGNRTRPNARPTVQQLSRPFRPLVSMRTEVGEQIDFPREEPCSLFSSTSPDAVTDLWIWMRRSLPVRFGRWMSLYFDLDLPSHVKPQWERLADDAFSESGNDCGDETAASPESVQWHVGHDLDQLKRPLKVIDGTHGFRRSGIVQIALPSDVGEFDADSRGNWGQPPLSGQPVLLFVRIRPNGFANAVLPRVRRILPNALIAIHEARVGTLSAEENGELWKQMLQWRPHGRHPLQLTDALRPPMANSRRATYDRHGDRSWQQQRLTIRIPRHDTRALDSSEWPAWSSADELGRLGHASRNFIIERDGGRLVFGDGLHGAIPWIGNLPLEKGSRGFLVRWVRHRLGLVDSDKFDEETKASLKDFQRDRDLQDTGRVGQADWDALGPPVLPIEMSVGGGQAGNVVANRPWVVDTTATEASIFAVNVIAATGGRDRESIEQAGRRAASKWREVNRTVTPADIGKLAKQTPDVAVSRVCVRSGRDPHFPLPVPGAISVSIVPELPPAIEDPTRGETGEDLVALQPNEISLERIRRHLNDHKLLTQQLHVTAARYRNLKLRVEISGVPADAGELRRRVRLVLQRYTHPVLSRDFDSPWPFGHTVRSSELVRVVQDRLDDGLNVTRIGVLLASRCPRRDQEGGAYIYCDERERDLQLEADELVALREVEVRFVSSANAHGGLR